MHVLQATDAGVLIRLRVQPRASADRLEGVYGDHIRLRLTAPPVDGAANTACVAFLAKTLGIRGSQVHIRAGAKSREKLVHVTGLTPAEVAAALGVPPP